MIEHYEQLLAHVWIMLGKILLRFKAFPKASAAFGLAQRLDSSSIASYWKGWAEFNAGNLDTAIEEYNRYVVRNERDEYFGAAALAMVGYIYGLQEHYDLSLSFYEKALRLRSERSCLLGAGLAAFNLNALLKAKQYFARALEDDPSDCEALRATARADLDLRNYRQAERRIRQYIEHDPNEPDMHAMLGYVHAEKGEYLKAIEALHEALRLRPDDTNTLVGLATCYKEEGSYEDAIKYYTRAMELEPDNAKHFYLLSNAYFLLKRFSEALEHFKKARDLDVDEKYANYKDYYAEQYVSILTECGLQEEARAERDALHAADSELPE